MVEDGKEEKKDDEEWTEKRRQTFISVLGADRPTGRTQASKHREVWPC